MIQMCHNAFHEYLIAKQRLLLFFVFVLIWGEVFQTIVQFKITYLYCTFVFADLGKYDVLNSNQGNCWVKKWYT